MNLTKTIGGCCTEMEVLILAAEENLTELVSPMFPFIPRFNINLSPGQRRRR